MLNEILEPFKDYFSFLNLFEYITFRAGASAILSLLISFIFGPFVVRKLTELQIGESIGDHGPKSHQKKQGTPTMGGVLIILATIIPTLLFADTSNLFIRIICFSMVIKFWLESSLFSFPPSYYWSCNNYFTNHYYWLFRM